MGERADLLKPDQLCKLQASKDFSSAISNAKAVLQGLGKRLDKNLPADTAILQPFLKPS